MPKTTTLCAFCQAAPAVVQVPLPSLRSSKKHKGIPTPFCLLHYYTTSAIRVGGIQQGVTILHPDALNDQFSATQDLFQEAFVDLKDLLDQTALDQFATHRADPLAVLVDLHSTKKKRTTASKPKKRPPPDGGGFLTHHPPLPQRIVATQKRQKQVQVQLLQRMQKHSASDDTTKRRQPTRKSIWNVVQQQQQDKPKPPPQTATLPQHDTDCTCGSSSVVMVSKTSAQTTDMAKAETWGNKDRTDETKITYQCHACGKLWTQDE